MRKRTRILRLVFVLAVAVPLMPSFGLMTLREEAGQAATGVRISIQVSRPPGNAYPYRRMLTSQPHYFTEGAPGVVPSPPQIGGGRNGATEFRSRSAGFPQSIKVPRNASRRSRSPWLICPPAAPPAPSARPGDPAEGADCGLCGGRGTGTHSGRRGAIETWRPCGSLQELPLTEANADAQLGTGLSSYNQIAAMSAEDRDEWRREMIRREDELLILTGLL
jgi:hypothetical protein